MVRGATSAPALRVPARPGLVAAVVYALATMLVGWPALAGRFLVSLPSDQYIAGYAFREFAAQQLRAGQGVPLWNPYLFGGMPYVAAMHGDVFYLTQLLRIALPTDVAMTWGFIVHLFSAGLLTYAFLRRAVGIGFYAALVGGLAYMLGGNVAGLVSPGHDGKLFVATLLPLALLCVHAGVREGRTWAWGALALTVTGTVLTPHPQLAQYLLLVCGAYGLYAAFASSSDTPALARGVALRRLGLAAIAVGVGLLGGAVQYWPVLEYTPWSPRDGGKDWTHAISYSMPPEELINTYLPQFSGVLERYTGRNSIHFHSEYLGAAVLPLVGLALGGVGALRRHGWFWLGVLVVATLWALGGFTPFYSIVYAIVPGTKYFRAPSTMLYVVGFATAVLAALGTERALSRGVRLGYVVGWLVAGVAVALLATTGMLTNVATAFALEPLADRVPENAGALTLGAWRSLVAAGAAVGVLWAAATGRLSRTTGAAALVAVVALDLWSVARQYWRFLPPAAEIYAADPTITYLRAQSDSGRVLTVAADEAGPVAYHDAFLRGDALMTHRVRQTLGYHGNELGRYQRLYQGDGQSSPIANPNFWRLTNTRFLLTNIAEVPLPGATRVAGPVRNAAGTMTYLYRLPGDNPPAWVTPIAVKAPDQNVLATVLDPRFDVGRVALFDTAAAVTTQPVPTQLPAPLDLRVSVKRPTPDRVVLDLASPAPSGSTLVVAENYYPGWSARADGAPAAVGRVDLSLIGVSLPAGARRVELAFASPRYERGKLVTLLVVLAAGAAAVGGALFDRRSSRGRGAA